MQFTIFTHVEHNLKDNSYFAYAPYVREMNIWIDKFDQVEIVAPLKSIYLNEVTLPYKHSSLKFTEVFAFDLLNLWSVIKAIGSMPFNCYSIFKAMNNSDHIHIRTPGNIGLLASIIQICFPNKKKTVKYAGNWDPKSKQPWSYRLQKWILSSAFLSKNIKVLVYGEWQNQSKNVMPFFTASLSENEGTIGNRYFTPPFKFIFVGSLSTGKRPLFAIQMIENLKAKGIPVKLELYGSGQMKEELQEYIITKNLDPYISLRGNLQLHELKEIYKISHFLILASKSEGWPKAVAEAMFFGCIPVATSVSCVPYMLNYGDRGILIESDLKKAVLKVISYLKDEKKMIAISNSAITWSNQFTLEKFENEITELL